MLSYYIALGTVSLVTMFCFFMAWFFNREKRKKTLKQQTVPPFPVQEEKKPHIQFAKGAMDALADVQWPVQWETWFEQLNKNDYINVNLIDLSDNNRILASRRFVLTEWMLGGETPVEVSSNTEFSIHIASKIKKWSRAVVANFAPHAVPLPEPINYRLGK